MTSEQIIGQIEFWIKGGRLTFDALEILTALAYAKEAADDEQE